MDRTDTRPALASTRGAWIPAGNGTEPASRSWAGGPAAASAAPPPRTGDARSSGERTGPERDPLADLKQRVHEQLLQEIDLDKISHLQGPELRKVIEEAVALLLLEERVTMSRQVQLQLVAEIANEVLGLGPLEPLLRDPAVSEIMVNGPDQVYVEKDGLIALSDVTFRDQNHIKRVIERIVAPLGRHIDEASPMVDARLADGSRVNAIIPPLAIDGPLLTVRKFAKDPPSVDKLIASGSLTPAVVHLLRACVQGRLNVLISGGTGSGKTTLLNILSGFIPPRERIVSIEDPCELQLRQPHVCRLETRPANVEGRGEITQRQLVRNALRMRPDRIIVGEVRSGEAFDMLQAMNTGHDGSLTTVHANTARDALGRIENMVLMAGLELPIPAIREQIVSAVSLVVHVSRLPDGSRKVTQVTEVLGMDGNSIAVQDLFLLEESGLDAEGNLTGHLSATGRRPGFADRLRARGVTLTPEIFTAESQPGETPEPEMAWESAAARAEPADVEAPPRPAPSPAATVEVAAPGPGRRSDTDSLCLAARDLTRQLRGGRVRSAA